MGNSRMSIFISNYVSLSEATIIYYCLATWIPTVLFATGYHQTRSRPRMTHRLREGLPGYHPAGELVAMWVKRCHDPYCNIGMLHKGTVMGG